MNKDQFGDKVGFDLAKFFTPVAKPVTIEDTCPVETLLCVHDDVDRQTGYTSYIFECRAFGKFRIERNSRKAL